MCVVIVIDIINVFIEDFIMNNSVFGLSGVSSNYEDLISVEVEGDRSRKIRKIGDGILKNAPSFNFDHALSCLSKDPAIDAVIKNVSKMVHLSAELESQLYSVLKLVQEQKEVWEAGASDYLLEGEVGLKYSFATKSVAVILEGSKIDFDALFIMTPGRSYLGNCSFKGVYEYICLNKANLIERIEGARNNIYLSTRDEVEAGKYLPGSLLFMGNQTVLHFNKMTSGEHLFIGRGGSKTIRKARILESDRVVASASFRLEGFHKKPGMDAKNRTMFEKELFWADYFKNNPDYIKMEGCVEYPSKKHEGKAKARIIYELIQGKDLCDLIIEDIQFKSSLSYKICKQGVFSFESKVFVVKEIARIVHELHSQDIIHGDIKPENFMFTDLGKVKVIDLGSFSKIDEIESNRLKCIGTLNYTAPEAVEHVLSEDDMNFLQNLVGDSFFRFDVDWKKLDVWAFAVFLATLFDGDVVGTIADRVAGLSFDSVVDAYTRKFIFFNNIDSLTPEKISSDFDMLLRDMLRKNPQDRISMEEVVIRLNSLDWNNLRLK